MSSGNRKVHRLSLRGNRRVNHAIHMAAITQLRYKHSPRRAYYDKKIAEGRTHEDALRSPKQRISDTIYARLQADARQAAKAREKSPGECQSALAEDVHDRSLTVWATVERRSNDLGSDRPY